MVFCGYDQTNEKTGGNYLSGDEPSNCSGSSLTELGFTGTQAAVNTALATLQFKGNDPTITIKAYETDSDPVHYYKETGHFIKLSITTIQVGQLYKLLLRLIHILVSQFI